MMDSLRRRRCLLGVAGAASLLLSASAHASGSWHFGDLRNPLGDTATAVLSPASDGEGATLYIACDGDRWRRVVLGPGASGTLKLDRSGEVRVSLAGEPALPGRWKVGRAPSGGVTYDAPQATDLARRLVRAGDDKSPAVYPIAVTTAAGKRVKLRFPLAGLAATVRAHLWKPCKLGTYFVEPRNR